MIIIVFRILFYLIRTLISGERYYFILLNPDRSRLYDGVNEMSAPLIADGVNASIMKLINDGRVRAQWSDAELASIKQQYERAEEE